MRIPSRFEHGAGIQGSSAKYSWNAGIPRCHRLSVYVASKFRMQRPQALNPVLQSLSVNPEAEPHGSEH